VNGPIEWWSNCPPTSATYFSELRKQYDAQWSATRPWPPSTNSSSAFSSSGAISSWFA
jgi:hypothetical protein